MIYAQDIGYVMNEITSEKFPLLGIDHLQPLSDLLVKRQNQLMYALPSRKARNAEDDEKRLADEKAILLLPHGYWFDTLTRVGGDIFALIQRQLNCSTRESVEWAFNFVNQTMPDLPGSRSHFVWCVDSED